MRSTPYHHYALYEADAAPDLTATGEYNSAIMGIDADLHAEETEISANSADLTGIKGLTYGEGGQVFLENEDGSYSSPALEEIKHEVSDLQAADWYNFTRQPGAPTYLKEDYEQMLSHWPKCYMLLTISNSHTTINPVFWPHRRTDTHMYLWAIVQTTHNNNPGFLLTEAKVGLNDDDSVDVTTQSVFIPLTTWETLTNKPFTTIGTGLKVVSDALTVDTAAIPTGITGNTTWGEIEQS